MTAVAAENPEGGAYLKKVAAEDARIRFKVSTRTRAFPGIRIVRSPLLPGNSWLFWITTIRGAFRFV